ncbi:hypothetical protein E3N88_31652 [Mikania micrantha]|uniref:RRM domain-containing protein n=1 Tax=Mikania micrantha TaxID=192012 RepID=A0A5N6M6Z9_9ASTR|nr:hypothetical protein E3N88_31652 [Mikania micrantha]
MNPIIKQASKTIISAISASVKVLEDGEGVEDGEWEQVNHRKRKTQRKRLTAVGMDAKDVTTIFITNLPDGFTSGMLWKMCLPIGNIADAFIASKKDKGGNTFGFVRFRNVSNTERLVTEINMIKLGGTKIAANIARYGRNKRPIAQPVIEGRVETKSKRPFISGNPTFYKGGRSFKEIVAGHHGPIEDTKSVIQINVNNQRESKTWWNRSLIGETLDLNTMNKAKSILMQGGIPNAELKYVGGLKMIIVFNSSKECMDYWKLKVKEWKKVFKNLEIWKGLDLHFDRIAWVKVIGVPLQLWDCNIFDQIGEHYGKIIAPAFNFDQQSDVSEGWFCVLTSNKRRIEESRQISWQNQIFEIWLQEEVRSWAPDEINTKLLTGEITSGSGEKSEEVVIREEAVQSEEDNRLFVFGETHHDGKNTTSNVLGNMEKNLSGFSINDGENIPDGDKITGLGPTEKYFDAHHKSGPLETNQEMPFNNSGPEDGTVFGAKVTGTNVEDISIDLNECIGDSENGFSYSNRRRTAKPSGFGKQSDKNRCWITMHNIRTDKYWEARKNVSQSSMSESSQTVIADSLAPVDEMNKEDTQSKQVFLDDEINEEVSNTLEIGNLVGFDLIGLGGGRKQEWIQNLRKEGKVTFILIQETQHSDLSKILSLPSWNQMGMEYDFVNANGRSGGLLSMWDSSAFTKKASIKEQFFMVIIGNIEGIQEDIFITNVYSPQDLSYKQELWSNLSALKETNEGIWLIGGDFNEVRNHEERAYSRFIASNARHFNEFIAKAGLIEYKMGGRKFTYYAEDGKSMSKIDRIMVCEKFVNLWPNAIFSALPCYYSDHCPLTLSCSIQDFGPPPFKLFNGWMELEGFSKTVQKAMCLAPHIAAPDRQLLEKLKLIKTAIKVWRKESMNVEEARKKDCESTINLLDQIGEIRPLDESEWKRAIV